MFKRIALTFALMAGMLAGGGVVTTDTAQARYYDETLGIWIDERKPEYNRRIDKRKPPSKFNRRNVIIRTSEAPGTIIIHTDKKFLFYIIGRNRAVRYGVGVGRDGFGWNGTVSIKRKEEWPVWIPPHEMIVRERENGRDLPARMEGGPSNPLGARAMYLYRGKQDTLYRIHGTNQPWSIGLNLSSGCFRMLNKDVEDLYRRADIGTKVIVIGPGEDHRKYYSAFGLGGLFGG